MSRTSCSYHLSESNTFDVDYSYFGHESLAYGVDWIYDMRGNSSHEEAIISCSFYDHNLQLWQAK